MLRNSHPLYRLGVVLRAQERWLTQQLSELKPQLPTSILDTDDHMTRLRHYLDWYANLPWFHRFWLRRTTNISLLCRYYTYHYILTLLSPCRDATHIDTLHQHLQQYYHTTNQAYLATFSWDRLLLNWYSRRITSAWQAMRQHSHSLRRSDMKKQLHHLLTQTNHEVNNYAQAHWTLRLIFPTSANRARQLKLDDAHVLARTHAYVQANINQNKPRGLHEYNRHFQAYTRLVYYKLLEQALHTCLAQFHSNDIAEHEVTQAWQKLEKILIEVSSFTVNKQGQLASGHIWKIYLNFSLQLSELSSMHIDAAQPWSSAVYNTCCTMNAIQTAWLQRGARWQTPQHDTKQQPVLRIDNNTTHTDTEPVSAAPEQSYYFNATTSAQAACYTLGLDPTQAMTWNSVRIAYKRLLLLVHPDKQVSRPAAERLSEAEAVARSQTVTQAFRYLFDLKEQATGRHNANAWADELRQFDQQFQDYVQRVSTTVKHIVENRERNTLRHRQMLATIAQLHQNNQQLDEDSRSRLVRLETSFPMQVLAPAQEPDSDVGMGLTVRSEEDHYGRSPLPSAFLGRGLG